ncbi:MAG TPA: reverse transcriptase domain-containing protein [Gammaproteobacteria bacterium]|nr:reverse transcriptase domain-containing protein [Gammaproteobacteria bacterium]
MIQDQRILRLLCQVMNRVHDHDENHRLIEHQSILRGCSLSPLFGAIYLLSLDPLAHYNKIDYVRYMDDIVFFFKTRHQLKNMLKKIYSCVEGMQLKLSNPKTWIGRVDKGFDYLGYRISPEGLTIAEGSLGRLQDRLHRLLEQGAGELRPEKYVKNWMRWFKTGVSLKTTAFTNIASLLLDNFGWRLHV